VTAPSVGSVSGGECDAVAALHALASALDLAAAGVSAGLSSLASLPLLSASAALAALALALAAAARQRLGVSAGLSSAALAALALALAAAARQRLEVSAGLSLPLLLASVLALASPPALPLLSASAALAALALALSSAVALALAAAARQRLGVSARLALLAWPRRPCWLGRPSSIAQLAEERGASKMS
jgi:hypothetical protein